ncbi:murein transglycosylase A [Labrenzia sp. PHM005]|uniref:murein transglycosylase A n=1 Tax=Labrenzia sp. PHM005 TaxID=2590016 RepID=UPI001AD9467B|nr:MltA domain-containing protein [Labrenzia sp. PHM005]
MRYPAGVSGKPQPSGVARCMKGAALAASLFVAGPVIAMAQSPLQSDDLTPVRFADLAGWAKDDHQAALAAFLRFCGPDARAVDSKDLFRLNQEKKQILCAAAHEATDARIFFENHFEPFQIRQNGFVTGYFEPEVSASREKTGRFSVPLLQKPDGLVHVPEKEQPKGWPKHLSHGRLFEGTLNEMPDRAAIMDGALVDEALELVWLNPIDAYFIHVQGSARLKLTDGSTMRVGYAGKTGHPYSGIAKLLVQRGEGTPEDFTMSGLRHWLEENPDKRDALFKENRSYIFFREVTETGPDLGPIGAASLPLVPGRSLAIDDSSLPYGMPVFVSAGFEDPDAPDLSFQRLMLADDTGSAIKGHGRGDVFIGSGEAAGRIAGEIRHKAVFTVLVPKSAAASLKGRAD